MSIHTHSAPHIVLLDDQLAEENSLLGQGSFLREVGSDGSMFSFCTGWDESAHAYSLGAVELFLKKLHKKPSLFLVDIRFGSQESFGLQLVPFLAAGFPDVPILMMSNEAKASYMEKCLALGAIDYLCKPLDKASFWRTVNRYLDVPLKYWLVGQSGEFLDVLTTVAMSAEGGQTSVLLTGESGTGKELFARYLHRHGPRRNKPFVVVDIGAIPVNLLEGELFGYSKGAFTDASEKVGKIVEANGGVLFFDEVNSIPFEVQHKLLRVLEEKVVYPLGDKKPVAVDIQCISASNQSIARLVKEHQFRYDLYYRIAATVVNIPNLSERKEDVPNLLRHLCRRVALERGIQINHRQLQEIVQQSGLNNFEGNIRGLWNWVQVSFDRAGGKFPSYTHFRRRINEGTHLLANYSVEEKATPIPSGLSSNNFPLELIPMDMFQEDLKKFESSLLQKEVSFLYSALVHTRDPVTSEINRSKAASFYTGRRSAGTIIFDREFRRVWKKLSRHDQNSLVSSTQIIRQVVELLRLQVTEEGEDPQ